LSQMVKTPLPDSQPEIDDDFMLKLSWKALSSIYPALPALLKSKYPHLFQPQTPAPTKAPTECGSGGSDLQLKKEGKKAIDVENETLPTKVQGFTLFGSKASRKASDARTQIV